MLFATTYALDRAAFAGDFGLPGWVLSGSPDAARQILIAIAAAVITVVGVVFSMVIVTSGPQPVHRASGITAPAAGAGHGLRTPAPARPAGL